MDERDGLAEASSTTSIEDAKAQHPLLDTSAPAASEETPSGEDMVVLAQTPEEVEAQYRQSAFIKEICVVGTTSPDEPNAERLFAVVVPDADLLRERRIVNAGDLLRFEIEGQSIG